MDNKTGTWAVLEAFGPISHEAWLDKIRKDMKGREPGDFSVHYDKDLIIEPFVGPERETPMIDIDFDPNWEIAEEFTVEDEAVSNAEILASLRGGCETILLKVSGPGDWDIVFDGIELSMVKCYVIPPVETQEATSQSLESWLSTKGDSDSTIHLRSDQLPGMSAAQKQSKRSVVDKLTDTMKQGLRMLETGYSDEVLECIVHTGNDYFVEIARMRALRILWRNILIALDREKPRLFIENRFAMDQMDDDMYLNMISAGAKAHAAICGGTDRLVIAPSGPEDSFTRRISRNIHHIYRYESRFDEMPDPVTGSWFIDAITVDLVEKTWERLKE